MGFLGKQEPQKKIKSVPTTEERRGEKISAHVQLHRHRNTVPKDVLPLQSQIESETLLPLLNGHRLGTGAALSRPNINRIQETQDNNYVFLSSSPPRSKQPSTVIEPAPVVPAPGLIAKPAIMSLVRPARTLHTTSMAIAQGSGGVKKTLGVKRSMNGWTNRTAQPFVPPTRKKEN